MLPNKYSNFYIPIKYFLSSYRALSDGRSGIQRLRDHLDSDSFFISDWKILWLGSCTLLRTSIDLFRVDAKTCINSDIRDQLITEWSDIKANKSKHQIFWDFLRHERDNIIHEYEWAAYEVWMDQEGRIKPARISLFDLKPSDARSVLLMKAGHYKGRDSLELLAESADWVEDRIFSAIRRAGFSPDEERNLVSFGKRPPAPPSLLSEHFGK